ncbi:MAG TPA: DUF962 domain-containing protein [Pirellulales bacterium]|nr:DUF962 domain-containing protein [Pirellulales bacterium]
MPQDQIKSFEEFWPFYVREHSLLSTRIMHFVGTTLSFVVIGAAIAMQMWWLLVLAPVAGYGMAWISHFGIEKNKPASFKYPLWSFIADMKLWALMATGRMGAEAQRILGAPAK